MKCYRVVFVLREQCSTVIILLPQTFSGEAEEGGGGGGGYGWKYWLEQICISTPKYSSPVMQVVD